MGENGNLSAADVALLQDRNGGWNDMFGGNSLIFLIAILAMMNGGFGWGGNRNNAIGYENLATQSQVDRGFDTQNMMANQRETLAAVTSGTAQAVAATNQTFHDTIGYMGDKYMELQRDIAALAVGQANALANQNECCCNLRAQIAQNNYDAAMRDANTNANVVAQSQKILDAITGNRMADMQNEINDLRLAQAMQGVVRYPNGFVYNAGNNPFCGCNNGFNM